jgi:hypothetical protein
MALTPQQQIPIPLKRQRANWAWWLSKIIDKYDLRPYYLTPVIPRALAKSWSGHNKTAKRAEKRAEYPPKDYKPTHFVSQNAIGFDEHGDLMFLYLQTIKGEPAISQRVRSRALTGLLNLHKKNLFRPCDESYRPELREAIEKNGPNAPVVAGEINTGWMHLLKAFEIGAKYKTYPQLLNQKHHLLPMLKAIDGIFATTLPSVFARHNRKIKYAHRHGLSPFSTLTLLRSAPSAVHLDGRNGAGSLACMTTVRGPQKCTGGEFCFVQYGVQISVQPGHLLIAGTPFHWHCNLSAVNGLKFSVIAYFKDALQRKREQICSICGTTYIGIPKQKPRCPQCLK